MKILGMKIRSIVSSSYAPTNGLTMYYEIHGEGWPLLLLHGSFMTTCDTDDASRKTCFTNRYFLS